jgi:hypothetical protein
MKVFFELIVYPMSFVYHADVDAFPDGKPSLIPKIACHFWSLEQNVLFRQLLIPKKLKQNSLTKLQNGAESTSLHELESVAQQLQSGI